MAVKICVLLSTCERYRAMAGYTEKQLHKYWSELPPVFCCGLKSSLASDCAPLVLRDDPADWMAVTRSACIDLLALGFSHAYLILDDHPPLALCHAHHLNQTIPSMAEELKATSISLSGYGQQRKRLGRSVQWQSWDLDLIPASELWKFPLHPALWNLEILRGILDHLMQTLPVAEHTSWAFERKGGDPASTLPAAWKSNSYRLNGAQMTARSFFFFRHLPLRLAQIGAEVWQRVWSFFGGPEGRQRREESFRWLKCPYDGPYPLFWSGLMAKGQINPHLVRYWRACFRGARIFQVKELIDGRK